MLLVKSNISGSSTSLDKMEHVVSDDLTGAFASQAIEQEIETDSRPTKEQVDASSSITQLEESQSSPLFDQTERVITKYYPKVLDSNMGRTYYLNQVSGESQWTRPYFVISKESSVKEKLLRDTDDNSNQSNTKTKKKSVVIVPKIKKNKG
jgi:WW domain